MIKTKEENLDKMIYVIGHKNPDTDSVVSAIAYAELKKKLGFKAVAARAGEMNEQTKFVLNYFKQEEPLLVKDLYLRAEDIMTKKVIFINESDSVEKAIKEMEKSKIRYLPLIKNNKEIIGIVSFEKLADYFLIETIKKKNTLKILKKKASEFCDKEFNLCYEEDTEKELNEKLLKSKFGSILVVDKKKHLRGIITKTDLLKAENKKVILVDHNEFSQAVEGIENAEILDVVDHHRLAAFTTLYPINFLLEPVGSTSTIVFEIYKKNNLNPDKKIAGLLLCGIISDTLNLTSTTTTEKDKKAVSEISKICDIKPEFIWKKFEEISKKEIEKILQEPAEKIIENDFKIYENKKKIGLGQLEINEKDFHKIKDKEEELIKAMENLRKEKGFNFIGIVVTDNKKLNSLLLCSGERDFLELLPWPKISENLYELKGIFSRKKQIAPVLLQIAEGKLEKVKKDEDYYKKK